MMRLLTTTLLALCLCCGQIMAAQPKPQSFSVGEGTFLLNGKPFVVKAAEVHYPRIPRDYWEHRIKMCKSLGMNTICIYAFWNIHEQREGVFDFTGQNDIAAFCRLAQKHGMYIIVRPGPYACAEWEMGGLPWWLLKKKDISLRESDSYFMERAKLFEEKLAEQLSQLAIQNGGSIIMVQVENEYGSYGEDKVYMGAVRDIVRKAWGKDIVLFQCDWSSNFWKNGLDDLTWTMNFGTGANIDQQFKRLREMRPKSPLMCSEFWSGWFDKWGARHETRPADKMVQGIDEMLSKSISFSLYMAHGGTSFGHWAGANSPGFAPDVTSYDYDAPINEYGVATEKYYLLRQTLQKYSDKQLPAVPKAPMAIIPLPQTELTEFAPLQAAVDKTTEGPLQTFEEMDMGWGSMAYSTRLPEIKAKSVLTAEVHDYAQVFIDEHYIGSIDRVHNERQLVLPPVKAGSQLLILVEGMGRINFGRAIKDYKGIVSDVTLTATIDDIETMWKPRRWTNLTLPDDYATAQKALSEPNSGSSLLSIQKERGIGYYRGYIRLSKVGDTFLNTEAFGKGQVWVNGHAIGRYWHIGPQQTLYVPGCWLKKGQNEIVVLDIAGPAAKPIVFGQTTHELNKLNLEKAPLHNDAAHKPDLSRLTAVAQGALNPGNGWQTVRLAQPATGRYLALECRNAQKGDIVAIAELYLNDAKGQRLSRESWTVHYAGSEDEYGNHMGDKVFDLQESTYWQTTKKSKTPHLLVIDLGSVQTVSALEYLPRAEQGAPGSVKDYRLFVY